MAPKEPNDFFFLKKGFSLIKKMDKNGRCKMWEVEQESR